MSCGHFQYYISKEARVGVNSRSRLCVPFVRTEQYSLCGRTHSGPVYASLSVVISGSYGEFQFLIIKISVF